MKHIGKKLTLREASLVGGEAVEMADYLVVKCLMVLLLCLREPCVCGSQTIPQGDDFREMPAIDGIITIAVGLGEHTATMWTERLPRMAIESRRKAMRRGHKASDLDINVVNLTKFLAGDAKEYRHRPYRL